MLFREKVELAAPGKASGNARSSALKGLRDRILLLNQPHPTEDLHSSACKFDEKTCSPEFHRVIGILSTVRRRVLANTLLSSWTKWAVWIMVALFAVGVASAKLGGAVLFLSIAAALGALAILVWAWRTRASHYEAARRLDSAAVLQDRVSTAIYFGDIDHPQGLIAEQRKDALARAIKLDPRGFFPVRLPVNIGRASALFLVVAGLFAYRIHHKPPLTSLLQTTARSQFVQSLLSPLVHAMENDLQRAMALVTGKPEETAEDTRRKETASADDLWNTGGDKGPAAEDQADSSNAATGDQQQDQLQANGAQNGDSSGESRQEDAESQSQDGKTGNDSAQGNSQQQSAQQGPESRQSLGQSLMQALKNMLSNSPSQQASNRSNQQQPNGQGTPQSGNSNQQGSTESDKRGESHGSSDAKQKANQTASEGAGNQEGSKELRKDAEMHPVNALADRVALEASGFKDQTRMKIATETGSAQLPVQDQAPQADAVTNGAEQESIPARYRFYVQRYFEHPDNGSH